MDRLVSRCFVVLAVFMLVLLPRPAHAATSDALINSINSERYVRGLPALVIDGELTAKASSWAAQMANVGTISHSTLSSGITQDWKRLGENVGSGGTVEAVAVGLLNSPGHLANIIDPGFTHLGVAAVSANGIVFVAEEFMELFTAPVPTAKPVPPIITIPPVTIPPTIPTTIPETTTIVVPPTVPTTIPETPTTTVQTSRLNLKDFLRLIYRWISQLRVLLHL